MISETTVIFIYALLSQFIDDYTADQSTVEDVYTLVHVSLYLSYSYIGCEISYPLVPAYTRRSAVSTQSISYPLRPFLRGCRRVQHPPAARQYHNTSIDDDNEDDDDDDDDEDIIINHACPSQSRHSVSSTFSSDESDDTSDDCRQRFWTCCMSVVEHCSWLMLRLNSDSELYARIHRQLSSYCPGTARQCAAVHPSLCREP